MTRMLKYTVIDAFTSRVFSGNPAAVIVLPDDTVLDAKEMQLIAREFNLSETAYVSKPRSQNDESASASGTVTLGLRWFTPRAEAPICGHATLAAAHVVFNLPANAELKIIQFETIAGTLTAKRIVECGKNKIQLEFPADLTIPVDDESHEKQIKDVTARALGGNAHDVVYVGIGSGNAFKTYILIEIAAPFDLAGAKINPGAFLELAPEHAVVILTTTRSSLGPDEKVDYVSRVFVPYVGIPEDPVTGSAQCMLGPYWTSKLHGELKGTETRKLSAEQVSARSGHFDVVWDREKGTCKLIGEAVVSAEGTLKY